MQMKHIILLLYVIENNLIEKKSEQATNKVPPQNDRKRTSDRTKYFRSGMLTFGRLRATSNKDIEQAVEQGRTRMWNEVAEQSRTSEKLARTSGETRTSNKGVEQGRTRDARTKCRTRTNKAVEQGRTRSNN